jgi:hypothetical protein
MEPLGVTGDVLNINHLNSELNPIHHFLALAGAHHFVDVSRIRVKGQQFVSFMLNRCYFKHTFLVSSLPTDVTSLVGTDFMAS